jgi:hypothetical protein
VTELKKRGITPVARVYTPEPAGTWVENNFLEMIDTAKKAYSAGFQLIQVGGNEPNLETGLAKPDPLNPQAELTPDQVLKKEAYLGKAIPNIVTAVQRVKAELPNAKIGSPAVIAGPQDSTPHEFHFETFIKRLAAAYDAAGVKPDWTATHTYCWGPEDRLDMLRPVDEDNITVSPPSGSGEGGYLGVPELSTEGGGHEARKQAMFSAMKETFRHIRTGRPLLFWLDYGKDYELSPLKSGNIPEGTDLAHYKNGLEFLRSCYQMYVINSFLARPDEWIGHSSAQTG